MGIESCMEQKNDDYVHVHVCVCKLKYCLPSTSKGVPAVALTAAPTVVSLKQGHSSG